MKDWKSTLVILALFGAVLFLVMYQLNIENEALDEVEVLIKNTKDSIIKRNTQLDLQIDTSIQSADSLTKDIIQNNLKISNTQKLKHEKAYRLYVASDLELQEFFAKYKTQDSLH